MAVLGDAYMTGKGAPQDIAKANELYRRSASKGFGPAMFALADCAQFGRGRDVDGAEAMSLFAAAESRGLPRAAARMSILYSTGLGVEKDPATARRLSKRAADQGDVLGKAAYGAMLRDGIGGPPDVAKSFELLSSVGTDHKIGYAHYQLALSYERGVGTAVDKDKAADSYRKALASGVSGTKQRLEALGFKD